MPYRYAVLWEHDDQARPAALVVQREDHVLVDARDELGIPSVWEEPFVVGSINGPFPVTYTPKDQQYFDQVLIDLSRTFSVGEQGEVPTASDTSVLRLLSEKIFAPLRASQPVPYAAVPHAGQFRTVRAYQQKYYADQAAPTSVAPEPPAAAAAEGSLVAA